MSNPKSKICPLLSKGEELVYCTDQCAWYCNENIPSMCMMQDISWTLTRIEKNLENIFIAMPDEKN